MINYNMQDTVDEGANAFHEGYERHDNPYLQGTQEYYFWDQGWTDGYLEIEEGDE